jgi:hypothetical protein
MRQVNFRPVFPEPPPPLPKTAKPNWGEEDRKLLNNTVSKENGHSCPEDMKLLNLIRHLEPS